MESSKIEEVEKYKKMYKDGLKLELRGLIIGAIIGLIFGIMAVSSGEPIFMCIFLVYEFAGIGLGWKTVNKITNKLFGNITIVGTIWFWVISLIIKIVIAACIGLFELPIFIIKSVIDYKKTMALADDIVKKEEAKEKAKIEEQGEQV